MPVLIPPPEDVTVEGHPVVVGFSGGLDSTVLLHRLLATGRYDLRAVHVHHGLHPEADAWARHCESVCTAWEVPMRVRRVEVARGSAGGPEAAARHARYAAFAEELAQREVLTLAHHLDDQAETFLLRALRGSGVDGLAAMRPWRPFRRGWVWRPLLQTARHELLAYARAHRLEWIDDPSNDDVRFDRNFLRLRVLPVLRERWPQADAAFARAAAHAAEAADLLDAGDAHALAAVRTADPHALDRMALATLPAPRRARVLRRWIDGLGLPALPAEGVERIEADLMPARGDAAARFQWGDARVQAWRGLLHAGPVRAPLPDGWSTRWDGRLPLTLPTGDVLSLENAPAFDTPCVVRARRGGERIRLPGRRHSHALKHVLQSLGVPPWERERLPLLCTPGDTVLAAADLAYDADFDTWLRDHDARLLWRTASAADPARPTGT